MILNMKSIKSMNLIKKLWNLLISEKIYEIYENFCPSKARFPFLLEARRAEHERGQSEPRQSPEAEDSADSGKKVLQHLFPCILAYFKQSFNFVM